MPGVPCSGRDQESLRDGSHACLEFFRDVMVHEFYCLKALIMSKLMNSTEWLKKIRLIVMVRCCKLSLYANESCDEHAIYFRR